MDQDFVKLRQIKPAFAGYISEAQKLLEPEFFPDEDTVHDVRVLMKKARAVLRMTSTQLNEAYAAREKIALREVGRIMSAWRDTSVFRKTLKYLSKDHPDIFNKLVNNERIAGLMKKEKAAELPQELMSGLQDIKEILNKSGFRTRFEPMNSFDASKLLIELEVTYNKVVNIYVASRNNLRENDLHEFRKRAKDFLYQLWFFRPLNPSIIKKLEKDLDSLTRNLGKYHDLAQLVSSIEYDYKNEHNDPALNELAIIIRNKQDQYLSKVWPVAYKIFCPGQKLVNILGFKLLVI